MLLQVILSAHALESAREERRLIVAVHLAGHTIRTYELGDLLQDST